MKTTHRPYSEGSGDFNRLCNFIVSNSTSPRTHTTWCLGRIVDWKYGLYDQKRSYASFCEENAQLWFDSFGELAGFAVSENGGSDFAIHTLPGYRFLYEEILLWVLSDWQSRGPCFSTELTVHQLLEREIIARYGFTSHASFFTYRYDLTRSLPPRTPLEAGFTMVDMHNHPDYRAQAILRADAFQGKSGLSEEELGQRLRYYNYSTNGPIYHPQTDLCVMAPDGAFAAGCEALIDARNVEADIERVCTHSAFRKRGFARAAIVECFYRLQAIGIRSAYITGYSEAAISLYASLEPADILKSFVYENA